MNPYEVVSVVPTVPCKIESLDIWADNLYVGTTAGEVLQYVVERSPMAKGKAMFKPHLHNKKFLGLGKKPVDRVQLMPGPGRLLALCDQTLLMLNMYSLEICAAESPPTKTPQQLPPPWKGVTSFAVQRGSFEFRLCVQTKKKLCLYEFASQNSVEFCKDIPIAEPGLVFVWHDQYLCVGSRKDYTLINVESGRTDTIMVHDPKHQPLVLVVGNEYLLSRDGQGVFFPIDGSATTRLPIQWQGNPLQLACHFPYIVALTSKSVEVYNIKTSQIVQTLAGAQLPIPSFSILQESCEPQDFLVLGNQASPACIYFLCVSPLDIQVQEMVKTGLVRESVDFFKFASAGPDGRQLPKDYDKRLAQTLSVAGMALFLSARFTEAFELLNLSDTNPQIPIGYFPELAQPNSPFFKGDHELINLIKTKLVVPEQAIEEKLVQARRGLMDFLERKKEASKSTLTLSEDAMKDLNTALIKLYASLKPSYVPDFLKTCTSFHIQAVETYLLQRKNWSSLAYYYVNQKRLRPALEIWAKLGTGENTDGNCDGLTDTVQLLSTCNDMALIWEFSMWVLKKDKDKGIEIFTTSARPDYIVSHEQVLTFLSGFHDDSIVQLYLEHIVTVLHEEKCHTMLAFLYVQSILNLLAAIPELDPTKEEGPLGENRVKLVKLLNSSSEYNTSMLLSQIHDTALYEEQIALYNQLGNYERVLRIMIFNLVNFERAERYCISHKTPSPCFLLLLQLYIEMGATNKDTSSLPLPQRAIDLLNNHARNFDLLQVLNKLPDSLPVQSILPCLTKALQQSFDNWRTGQITKNLQKSCLLYDKCTVIRNTAWSVTITEDRKCTVCHNLINSKVFARYPNGVLVCFRCIKSKNVCPHTGTDFKKTPATLL